MKLFSYVVDHDNGFAPNPFYNYCTLAHCKYTRKKSKRRGMIEMIQDNYIRDKEIWILGTGGKSKKSTGNGTIIYLMKLTEQPLTLEEYYEDKRFNNKIPRNNGDDINALGDNLKNYEKNEHGIQRYVLISEEYYYFGSNAIKIPDLFIKGGIEKKYSGYKCTFNNDIDHKFINWITNKYKNNYGMYGFPTTLNKVDKNYKQKLKRLRNC
jgi:hypothetical protein